MNVRKQANSSYPKVEKDTFIQRIKLLKNSGKYDLYVEIYAQCMKSSLSAISSTSQIYHRGILFLPWHRWFLSQFESELGCPIPYWDWTGDYSGLWENDFMGGDGDECGIVKYGPFSKINNWKLTVGAGVSEIGEELIRMMHGRITNKMSLPDDNRVRTIMSIQSFAEFSNQVHSMYVDVREWIGGSLSIETAPNDPIFWLMHSYLDFLWAQWQSRHPRLAFQFASEHILNTNLTYSGHLKSVSVGNTADFTTLGYCYDKLKSISRIETQEIPVPVRTISEVSTIRVSVNRDVSWDNDNAKIASPQTMSLTEFDTFFAPQLQQQISSNEVTRPSVRPVTNECVESRTLGEVSKYSASNPPTNDLLLFDMDAQIQQETIPKFSSRHHVEVANASSKVEHVRQISSTAPTLSPNNIRSTQRTLLNDIYANRKPRQQANPTFQSATQSQSTVTIPPTSEGISSSTSNHQTRNVQPFPSFGKQYQDLEATSSTFAVHTLPTNPQRATTASPVSSRSHQGRTLSFTSIASRSRVSSNKIDIQAQSSQLSGNLLDFGVPQDNSTQNHNRPQASTQHYATVHQTQSCSQPKEIDQSRNLDSITSNTIFSSGFNQFPSPSQNHSNNASSSKTRSSSFTAADDFFFS